MVKNLQQKIRKDFMNPHGRPDVPYVRIVNPNIPVRRTFLWTFLDTFYGFGTTYFTAIPFRSTHTI